MKLGKIARNIERNYQFIPHWRTWLSGFNRCGNFHAQGRTEGKVHHWFVKRYAILQASHRDLQNSAFIVESYQKGTEGIRP